MSRELPGGTISGNATEGATLNSSGLEEVMLLTTRSQNPVLLMVSVLLLVLPGQVLSKTIGSLTVMDGARALPEIATVLSGVVGSLLKILTVADLFPLLAGWNRIGASIESPAWMTSGNESALGTRKSVAGAMVMLVTVKSQNPLLLIVKPKSLKEPRQTSPKLPLSAIKVAILRVTPAPLTISCLDGSNGSSLLIWKIAVS